MKEPRLRLLNEIRTYVRLNEMPVAKRFTVVVDEVSYVVRVRKKQRMRKEIVNGEVKYKPALAR